MEDTRKKQLKQLGLLFIVIIVIFVIAIVVDVNLSGDTSNTTSTTEEETTEDSNEITVNGMTKSEVEALQGLIDEDEYEELMAEFEALESGDSIPEPENIVSEEDVLSDEEVDQLFTEADENGEYYYYTMPDGTETDIKIYNITLDQY